MSVLSFGFYQPEAAIKAAHWLRAQGIEFEVLSPYPLPELSAHMPRSAVRRFTLAGACTGFAAGFALASYAATAYLLPTGGRAIIALPPFLLIGYELTILFGVLATLAGFLLYARLPAWQERPYVPAASLDRIVLLISGELSEEIRAELIQLGAEAMADMENGS